MRRAAEGVGLDDVGAGREVALRGSSRIDVGPREHEVLVAALEARPAEVVGGEVGGLDGGAHRAVEDEDALFQGRLEGGAAIVRGAHDRFYLSDESSDFQTSEFLRPCRELGVRGLGGYGLLGGPFFPTSEPLTPNPLTP